MKLSAGSRPITFAETARGRSEIQCSIKMLAAELLRSVQQRIPYVKFCL